MSMTPKQPTMRMFVRRLEQMLNKVEQSGLDCKTSAFCPAHVGYITTAPGGAHMWFRPALGITCQTQGARQGWCVPCTSFMGIEPAGTYYYPTWQCPCHQYGTNAIPEARRRIAQWRKENPR